MKKRLTVLMLAVALMAACLPQRAQADNRVNFIAINDTLPSELVNAQSSHGGSVYVPYWLFTSYLGFTYTYSSSSSVVSLYNSESTLNFDLAEGKCYDSDGYYFSVSAIMRNGAVYLPLWFVQRYFSTFSYTTLTDSAYGDVLRIKTGTEVLTDTEFLRAAESIMEKHWQSMTPVDDPGPPDDPVETPNIHEGTELSLCFCGLPDAAALNTLSTRGVKACFFLSADDVRSGADTVRRLVCEGHSIGVRCSSEDTAAEFEDAAGLIYEAARIRPILITFEGADADPATEAARELGLVYRSAAVDFRAIDPGRNPQTLAYTVTSDLNRRTRGGTVFFSGALPARALGIVLDFLAEGKYNLTLLREI